MSPRCYLCGETDGDDWSVDHVPPKQLFAPELRKNYNLDQLVTLPTHAVCNSSYALDEQYLTWTFGQVAVGSPAANAVVAHHGTKLQRGEAVGLAKRILEQYEERPSGLVLPHDLIAVRVDGRRLRRVLWKIVRGLHMADHGEFVAEEERFELELIEPGARSTSNLSRLWEAVKVQPSSGKYPGVFDYKYRHFPVGENEIHAWGMLFWDRIMAFAAHFRSPPSREAES